MKIVEAIQKDEEIKTLKREYKEKYSKFEDLIMDCILYERLDAFKGGFKQATAIWKECL